MSACRRAHDDRRVRVLEHDTSLRLRLQQVFEILSLFTHVLLNAGEPLCHQSVQQKIEQPPNHWHSCAHFQLRRNASSRADRLEDECPAKPATRVTQQAATHDNIRVKPQ